MAAYYEKLAVELGLTIEASGPNFGTGSLADELAQSPGLASLIGERTRVNWPAGHDLRRIAVRAPAPACPLSLIWRAGNPHPALAALREFFRATWHREPGTWVPEWARSEAPRLPASELALRRPVSRQRDHAAEDGGHDERAAGGPPA